MTDVELVLHKLRRLREQIALVRTRRPAAKETLESDLVVRDALALALLVATPEAVDIAYHVAADSGWASRRRTPTRSRSSPSTPSCRRRPRPQ